MSCTDQEAAKEDVAGLMVASATAASDRVVQEATRLAQYNLAADLETQVEILRRPLDLISTQAASIISEAEIKGQCCISCSC